MDISLRVLRKEGRRGFEIVRKGVQKVKKGIMEYMGRDVRGKPLYLYTDGDEYLLTMEVRGRDTYLAILYDDGKKIEAAILKKKDGEFIAALELDGSLKDIYETYESEKKKITGILTSYMDMVSSKPLRKIVNYIKRVKGWKGKFGTVYVYSNGELSVNGRVMEFENLGIKEKSRGVGVAKALQYLGRGIKTAYRKLISPLKRWVISIGLPAGTIDYLLGDIYTSPGALALEAAFLGGTLVLSYLAENNEPDNRTYRKYIDLFEGWAEKIIEYVEKEAES